MTLLILAVCSCAAAGSPAVTFRTQTATFSVDAKGSLCDLARNADGSSFEHYLKQEGTKAGRAELIGILDDHLKNRGFWSDMQPLLRADITTYDPQAAGKYVKTHLLNLLPRCGLRGFGAFCGTKEDRYLNLVTEGLLCAAGQRDDKGGLWPGYGPKQ